MKNKMAIYYHFIFHPQSRTECQDGGGPLLSDGGLSMHCLKCACLFGWPSCDGQPHMRTLNISNPSVVRQLG